MLRKLLSRVLCPSVFDPRPATVPGTIEPLENRTLLTAPYFTNVMSDNRGEIILTTNTDLDASTVGGRSVQVYNVGPDGAPLTADDFKMHARIRWTGSNNRITIKVNGLVADTTYWFKASASKILGANGEKLDGEFNGSGKRSGDGIGGGDLLVVSKRDKSSRPTARISTFYGGLNVTLFRDITPITVNNFMRYANEAAWDGTFFHRLVPNFVIQGGGYFVSRDNQVGSVTEHEMIQNEFFVPNTRGRISMAKLPATDDNGDPIPGGGPDSATNEWFFNIQDNPDLDTQNGGFTAFGEINSQAGLDLLDLLAAKQTINAGGAFSQLPVNDAQAVVDRGNVIDPQADVLSIRRVAITNNNVRLIVPT